MLLEFISIIKIYHYYYNINIKVNCFILSHPSALPDIARYVSRVSSPYENASSENSRICGSRHVPSESAQKYIFYLFGIGIIVFI